MPLRANEAWDRVCQLLAELELESVPLAIGRDDISEDGCVIDLDFDDLANRTGGMDFRSDASDGARSLLYENRVHILRSYRLCFRAIHGVGLRFTSNPYLGMKWEDDRHMERGLRDAVKEEEMWATVEMMLPTSKRSIAKFFRQDAAGRHSRLSLQKARHDKVFRQLTDGSQVEENV